MFYIGNIRIKLIVYGFYLRSMNVIIINSLDKVVKKINRKMIYYMRKWKGRIWKIIKL